MPERNHPYCFADDLLLAVPEFQEIMEGWRDSPDEDILDSYHDCTTWTLSDTGHRLKKLRAKGDAASLSLIKRICDCINECAAKDYKQDDM